MSKPDGEFKRKLDGMFTPIEELIEGMWEQLDRLEVERAISDGTSRQDRPTDDDVIGPERGGQS